MPARTERSAGVLLYRIPKGSGDPEFLLLLYENRKSSSIKKGVRSAGQYWDYPKGHVEKGEDDLAAARRELAEETGITDAQFHPDFRHEITYFFRHKKKGLIKKTVVYFLGHTDARKIKISDEHVGGEFLPYEQALQRVTYDNAKAALKAAKAFLDATDRSSPRRR
jgi:8-oxo-dGTP pyrophosphatase MutT (NUDIX family)